MTAPRHPQSVHHQGMSLQDLLELPTSAPVVIIQQGPDGRGLTLAARVTGQGPVRRLNALLSVATHPSMPVHAGPGLNVWCVPEPERGGYALWAITPESALRLRQQDAGYRADDGLGEDGYTLTTFPAGLQLYSDVARWLKEEGL